MCQCVWCVWFVCVCMCVCVCIHVLCVSVSGVCVCLVCVVCVCVCVCVCVWRWGGRDATAGKIMIYDQVIILAKAHITNLKTISFYCSGNDKRSKMTPFTGKCLSTAILQ